MRAVIMESTWALLKTSKEREYFAQHAPQNCMVQFVGGTADVLNTWAVYRLPLTYAWLVLPFARAIGKKVQATRHCKHCMISDCWTALCICM